MRGVIVTIGVLIAAAAPVAAQSNLRAKPIAPIVGGAQAPAKPAKAGLPACKKGWRYIRKSGRCETIGAKPTSAPARPTLAKPKLRGST